MARLTNLLAGALALGSAANARVFDARMSNDLIPLNIRGAGAPATHEIVGRTEKPTVLKPVRPNLSKRDASNVFQVRNQDNLYWAGEDGTSAELKVDMPGDKEGFVNTEYFTDVVESMECPRNGTGPVVIHFADKLNLDSASDVWKWVQEKEDHEFTLMVGDNDCGWNDHRILYKITDIEFDDPTNTAYLKGSSVTWKKGIHSYEMNIGKESEEAKSKRLEYTPQVNIPFGNTIEKKTLSFAANGVEAAVTCTNCTTSGNFNIQGSFIVKSFQLQDANLALSTDGIDVGVDMAVELKGELTGALASQSWPLVKVSPGGVSIPGVLTLGPTVTIAIDAGVKAIKGGVKLTMSGVASVPKSTAKLDFLAEDKLSAEGWDVNLEADPMKADLVVESKATIALTASVGLEVSALESGFAAELTAELPALNAQLKAIESVTCTACSKYGSGIDGSVFFSTTMAVVMKKMVAGSYQKLWTLSLVNKDMPSIASFCQGIGNENCAA